MLCYTVFTQEKDNCHNVFQKSGYEMYDYETNFYKFKKYLSLDHMFLI